MIREACSASLSSRRRRAEDANALLDMQVENNQLVERSEAEKYELLSKIMNAENEILELVSREQKRDEAPKSSRLSTRSSSSKSWASSKTFGASGKL